jgi:hypothetical protein
MNWKGLLLFLGFALPALAVPPEAWPATNSLMALRGQKCTIKLTGSGKLKTATFFLNNAVFSVKGLEHDIILQGLENDAVISCGCENEENNEVFTYETDLCYFCDLVCGGTWFRRCGAAERDHCDDRRSGLSRTFRPWEPGRVPHEPEERSHRATYVVHGERQHDAECGLCLCNEKVVKDSTKQKTEGELVCLYCRVMD